MNENKPGANVTVFPGPAETPSETVSTAELPELVANESDDWGLLFNLRDWLRGALEAKGAEITGGGVGCGACDLDLTLEGMRYTVSMKPILRQGETA